MPRLLAIDTETTGVDLYHGARPFVVTMAWLDEGADRPEQRTWVWPVDPLTRVPQAPERDLADIGDMIFGLAGDDDAHLIGQNIKFDVAALRTILPEFTWPWHRTHDTLIAGHMLASNQPHDLTSMCLQEVGFDLSPLEEAMKKATLKARDYCRRHLPDWLISKAGAEGMPSAGGGDGRSARGGESEKSWKFDTWLPLALSDHLGHPPEHEWRTVTGEYAEGDSAATLYLWMAQRPKVEAAGLWPMYEQVRVPLLAVVSEMERRGVTASLERLGRLSAQFAERSEKAAEVCAGVARDMGYDLTLPKSGNNNSLRHFCFGQPVTSRETGRTVTVPWLGLPVVKKTPAGHPCLDAKAIEHYLATLPEGSPAHEFVRALAEKRVLDTAQTYMAGYGRFALPLPERPGYAVLHPGYNPTGSDTLRFGSYNPNAQNVCFDEVTEFLTTDGWVRADRLTDGHEVAQYWADTKRIDFVRPEIHRPNFKGSLRHIRTEQQIDLMVTPAHRCLLKDRKSGRLFDVRADEFRADCLHLHAGEYEGGSESLSQDQVTWFCAVQADGSYNTQKSGEYGVSFSFRKRRKIERLKGCLDRLGVTYRVREKDGTTTLYVGKHEPAVVEAKRLMPNKTLGPWLLRYDRETLARFADELFLWDGDSTRRHTYTSSDRRNTDWAQILFCLTGSRAWVREYVPNSEWAKNPHHVVNVKRGCDSSMTTNHTNEPVPHDGTVYCVTVPSSYVVVRRNGKVSVSGNSKKKGFNLRHAFGPAPGREWWALDYENLELRIPAYRAGEKAMTDLFERPNEPPYYGSYHMLVFDILHPEKFREHGMACKDVFKSTWYQWTKNGNFAVQYGAQESSGTADRAYHMPGAQARIQGRFTAIKAYSDLWIAHAERTGYVETVPDLSLDWGGLKPRGYPLLCTRTEWGKILPTVPLSYHIQGTAMWCTTKAMLRCDEQLRAWRDEAAFDAFVTLQVHDELVFDMPKGRKPWSNLPKVRKLQRLMQQSGDDIGVPLKVSVSYHPNDWGESEEFTCQTERKIRG